MSDGQTGVRTFLIADVRGYSRYTEEYGDEAAAELAARFAEIVTDGVEAHDGRVVELRGDEALAVFESARQAIRAAVDLQAQFNDADLGEGLPLNVRVGGARGQRVHDHSRLPVEGLQAPDRPGSECAPDRGVRAGGRDAEPLAALDVPERSGARCRVQRSAEGALQGQAQQRHVQPVLVGRRGSVGARPGQARRPLL